MLMSESDDSLPLYLKRQLAHECVRCGGPAVPDSDYCQPHLDDKRAVDRKWRSASRKAARKRRRCRDCKRKCKTLRCPDCQRKKGRGVEKIAGGVDKEQIWRVDPGTNWNRFRGKGRRGRLTREEQAEEDKRDINMAIADLIRVRDKGIPALLSEDVQWLPRFQREEARRVAMEPCGRAVRAIVHLARRYGVAISMLSDEPDPDR